ncbi:putative serine protease PepD [Microlunatus soli]|uniref:Putative serine protease PepD n=2 Tax=Microlunatus soli TaxID=630515 RepID=A0A1H1Q8N6_9ACTN|nr:putative serine protease PepD [Microlunatus soli]
MVAVLATVVMVALAVGGGAGYLGSRIAQSTAPSAGPSFGSGGLGPTAPAPANSNAPNNSAPTSTSSVPASKGAADTVTIAEQLLPSTVTIRVNTGSGTSLGSGFVIDGEGRIMTNNHVVDADGAIWVTNSAGHREKASVLGRSASYDLAVIQVDKPAGFRAARLGDSAKIKVGEAAVAIGSPLGLGGSVTEGIISAVNRPVSVGEANSGDGPAYLNALQTDAPINHGNSGGPLVDAGGAVIGVNSAILTGSGATSSSEDSGNIGIGFAIPINQARQIGQLLITDGYATYPVLNATVSGDGSGSGVLLSSVTPGGAADLAGLQPEDIVTSIDGQPVAETEDLIVAVRNHRPGDTIKLRYERDGSTHTATLKLASKRG